MKYFCEKYFSQDFDSPILHEFGTFCTKSTVTYIYFSQEGNYDLLKCQKIFSKIFFENIFENIFFYTNFEKYFYFSQEGNLDLLKCQKYFQKYFLKIFLWKYFFKISTAQFYTNFGTFCTKSTVTYIYFSQEGNLDLLKGRKIFQIEIRDLLYQIYGNIYLFITRGEARPFEMSKNILSENIFRKIFRKIFSESRFGTFCTRFRQPPILWHEFRDLLYQIYGNIYLFFTRGELRPFEMSKNIFKNIFSRFRQPILHEFRDLLYQIYGNIYLFFTRGEPRPFEMSKNIFKNIFCEKYFEKYFFQDFDSPILHEFRDILYQIYGNIYLFFTRGEPRPFEMSKNIFKNIFQKYFEKYFFKISTAPFYTNFGTFCTKSTVTYIYLSQEGNYDLLKCQKIFLKYFFEKYFSKNIFEIFFRKIFLKNIFTRFRQPNFTRISGPFVPNLR